ncbi:MAG: hypothetical protein K0R54_4954, partial [Clostridiaceae bacterium]|nr:hypothetical protein [Clostridiaceae bacterium]
VADEIKKLADNSKESVNYVRKMVKNLREDIGNSEEAITEAVNVFSSGKAHINEAAKSMDKMGDALNGIQSNFENISANIEEQTAVTQETASRLNEINNQTKLLSEACMKTGQGIYNISSMVEDLRKIAVPYFKDLNREQSIKPIKAQHLLLKWKAYNAVWGFAKLKETDIQDLESCSLSKFLKRLISANPSKELERRYEVDKRLHELTKIIISAVNSGEEDKINNYLKELDEVIAELIKEL